MKKTVLLSLGGAILVALALPPAVAAQGIEAFSGRWVIMRERCVPPQQQGQPTVQTGVPNRIDIEIEADTLSITVRKELRGGTLQRYTDTFAIDGEEYPFEHEGGTGVITAKWESDNLVITRRTEMQMQGRTMVMEQHETWQAGELEDGSPILAIFVQPPMPVSGVPGAGGMQRGADLPSSRGGGRMGGRMGGGRGGGTATVLAYSKRRLENR